MHHHQWIHLLCHILIIHHHSQNNINRKYTLPSLFSNVCIESLRQLISTNIFLLLGTTSDPSVADRTPLRRHQCFKKDQLRVLHQAYIGDPHPSTDILRQLATQLQVPLDKVRVSVSVSLFFSKNPYLICDLFFSNGSKIDVTVTSKRNEPQQQHQRRLILERFFFVIFLVLIYCSWIKGRWNT